MNLAPELLHKKKASKAVAGKIVFPRNNTQFFFAY